MRFVSFFAIGTKIGECAYDSIGTGELTEARTRVLFFILGENGSVTIISTNNAIEQT